MTRQTRDELNWSEHRDQLNAQLRWQEVRNEFYGNIMWEQKNVSARERSIATGRVHFGSDASRERYIGKHEQGQAEVRDAHEFYNSVVVPLDTRIKQAYRDGDAAAHISALLDANDVVLQMLDLTNLALSHRQVIDAAEAAAAMGRKGGRSKSPRKQGASRENGKKGGRPKKTQGL